MLTALRHRGFRLFWTAELVSRVGFWVQTIGQSWLVWELSRSALTTGLVAAIQLVPALVLAPVGGLLADRLPRQHLLLVTQLALSLTALGLWQLVSQAHAGVVAVAVAGAVSGSLGAIDTPARLALIPNLVPRDLVGKAVAADTFSVSLAFVLGPSLAAVILSTIGVGACFLVNGLSYGAVIVVLSTLRMKATGTGLRSAGASWPSALLEGFRFALLTSAVRDALLVLAAYVVLTMNASTLLPPFVDQVLRAGPGRLGLLLGAQGPGHWPARWAEAGCRSGALQRPVVVGSSRRR